MIEFRFDAERLKKIPNDIGHHAEVTTLMRTLGVPVVGNLMLRTVSAGMLTLHTEEDIDNDEFVYRWYNGPEWTSFASGTLMTKPRKIDARGNGDGYNWKRIDFGLNPVAVDDDEI